MGGYQLSATTADDGQLAKAWPRFWARLFDTHLYAFPAGLILGLLFPAVFANPWIEAPGGTLLLGILILPITLLFDAAVISSFGTSPGKAITGLRVATFDGEKLSLEKSLHRNLKLYLKGLMLGIPLLNLVGYAKGHADVAESGFTSWDEDAGSRVFGEANNEWRTVVIGILAIGMIVMDRVLASAGL